MAGSAFKQHPQQLLDEYQFTNRSGAQNVEFGDRVRVDDARWRRHGGQGVPVHGHGAATGEPGRGGLLGLRVMEGTQPGNLIPAGINGDRVRRDGGGCAGRPKRRQKRRRGVLKNVTCREYCGTVDAASVSVTALEHAAISALDESTVTSCGWDVAERHVRHQPRPVVGHGDIVESEVRRRAISGGCPEHLQHGRHGARAIERGQGGGCALAFNTIGWRSQNLLFNTIDALVGTGIGTEQPAPVKATSSTARSTRAARCARSRSDAQLKAGVANQADAGGMAQAGCSQATW